MPLSPARRPLLAVLFLLAAGGAALAQPAKPTAARVQPPPEEEEEKKPAPPPKKEMPPEEAPKGNEEKKEPADPKPEEPPAEGDPDGPYIAKLPNLQRAADTTPHEPLKPLFRRFAVAFDQLEEAGGKSARVTPLPRLWGTDIFPKEFGVADIADDGTVGDGRSVGRNKVLGVDAFEKLALDAAALLLGQDRNKPAPALLPGVRMEAAERLLREVLFFHDTARSTNRRRGKSWDKLKAQLDAKLAEVRVQLVRQAGADKDWARVKALTDQYLDRYKGDKAVAEQLYAGRLLEAESLVRSASVADLEQARLILGDYESRFPGSPNATAKAVKQALGRKAQEFLAQAERAAGGNKTDARRLLDAVIAIDPDNPAVRSLRQTMRTAYPTLIVGTRRLPERMSPALARFDSERQAVELLFEGLLERYPHPDAWYAVRPALAAARPPAAGGVRDVELVGTADWGGEAGVFDAADVHGTWRLYQQAGGSWAADPNHWLDEPQFDPGEPTRIRLRLRTGHPDARLLLTQKLLPANWLRTKNWRADAEGFARRPVGTGPFRLASEAKPRSPGDPPADVVLVANPAYARRPGRPAQPAIQEVRFTDVTGKDPAAEFRAGRLHVLTDVPTGELARFTEGNNLNNAVKVATAASNPRVWVLAINHRRPHLHDPDLRRAVSKAIDRELILTEVFRAGRADAHAALTGPFPPNSWATPRPLGAPAPPLFGRDAATALFAKALAAPGAPAKLGLAYPADDPQAKGACDRIKVMIEEAAKAGGRPLEVTPEPLAPRALLDKLEGEAHAYDLAYLPLDYPDPFPMIGLGGHLHPEGAGAGGRNVFGYRTSQAGKTPADERLAVLLDEARRHQDPAKLKALGEAQHAAFNEAVPFVPLWQLDRHLVLSTAVKVFLPDRAEPADPALLDPATLFNGVGRWRVE
jgi:ABC-type transport system substrate-binding protein